MPACVLDLVTCRLCRELLHVGLVVGLFTFVNTWEIEPVVGSGCGWGHPKTVPVCRGLTVGVPTLCAGRLVAPEKCESRQ